MFDYNHHTVPTKQYTIYLQLTIWLRITDHKMQTRKSITRLTEKYICISISWWRVVLCVLDTMQLALHRCHRRTDSNPTEQRVIVCWYTIVIIIFKRTNSTLYTEPCIMIKYNFHWHVSMINCLFTKLFVNINEFFPWYRLS